MKVALVSLGCSKNLVDSEIMLGFLKRARFTIAEKPEDADVAVVNTCAFIREAKEEAIDTIFELVKLKKEGKLKKVIVAGCLPELYKQKLASHLPEADGFIGPGSIDRIAGVIAGALKGSRLFVARNKHYLYEHDTPRLMLTPKHYAYLKIADGCDNRCSYCVIPRIRGRYQSRPMESIIKEAEVLSRRGVKEINLISQDTTFYGRDIYKKYALEALIKRLVNVKRIRWIRILYTHPLHLQDSLVHTIAREPKVCAYIDLPLQHINDTILKLMRRRVNGRLIRHRIDTIRRLIPGAALRTSIIVGFPQETQKRFDELYRFVRDTGFDRLGVFRYSREENTPASSLTGQVPEKVKAARYEKIMLLQQKIAARKQAAYIGKTIDVLIDELQGGDTACGRTQCDAPDVDGLVFVKGKKMRQGDMIKAHITGSLVYDLIGNKI